MVEGHERRCRRASAGKVIECPTATLLSRLFIAYNSRKPLHVFAAAQISNGREDGVSRAITCQPRVERSEETGVLARHVVVAEPPDCHREQLVGEIGALHGRAQKLPGPRIAG